MLITIPEPPGYFCESDEDNFFAWLKSLPAVKAVVGTPQGLDVTFDVPVDRLSFYELVGLLSRYQLPLTSLKPLCADHSDRWFNDPKNYWYSAVFA